jgi:thiol:disulfide interchange protein DsbD
VTAGAIQWRAPRTRCRRPARNYGYEGEVLLLTDVQVTTDAPVGQPLALKAKAEWLVCRETCIPEEAVLDLEIPVAEQPTISAVGPRHCFDARSAAARIAGMARRRPRVTARRSWSR